MNECEFLLTNLSVILRLVGIPLRIMPRLARDRRRRRRGVARRPNDGADSRVPARNLLSHSKSLSKLFVFTQFLLELFPLVLFVLELFLLESFLLESLLLDLVLLDLRQQMVV